MHRLVLKTLQNRWRQGFINWILFVLQPLRLDKMTITYEYGPGAEPTELPMQRL